MYTALKHSHMLLAVLTLLTSVIFLLLAWKAQPAPKSPLVYILTRIFGGLAAISGLAMTFVGPWQHMMFPYISLLLYAAHGLCAGFAKRSNAPRQCTLRRVLLVLQLLMLLVMSALMAMKPF